MSKEDKASESQVTPESAPKIEKQTPPRIPLEIKLDESWAEERLDQLDSQVISELFRPILIDCTSLNPELFVTAVKAIFRLVRESCKVEVPVVLLSCPLELIAEVKRQGSHPMIVFVKSKQDEVRILAQWATEHFERKPSEKTSASSKPKTTKNDSRVSIDVKYVNPFLDSALHVFKAQAKTDVRTGTPFRKEQSERVDGEVSGVINLSSTVFQGAVVISFPVATLQNLMTIMLGPKDEYSNDEIKSGAGELLNIIFAKGKATLNQQGHGVKSALPIVCDQPSPELMAKILDRVAVPFESDVGAFSIEIWGKAC